MDSIYNDANFGVFASEDKIYKKLKKLGLDVTHKQVKQFLSEQLSNQLTKPHRRLKQYNTVYAPKPRSNYQMDIIIYDRYEYHKYKYILCVIDVNSRYAQCRALTNRYQHTIIDKMNDIFKVMGTCDNLTCDNEFNTEDFNEYAKEHKIHMWYTDPYEINKNAIVERFNRTISSLIQKYRIIGDDYNWPSYLNDLVDNYNDTTHRTTKETPNDVFNNNTQSKQKFVYNKPTFKVGDVVRVKIHKKTFDKGDRLTYSKDTYVVNEVNKNRIKLDDGHTFKPYEIMKVNDIIYVKHDDTNEREHENQVIEKKIKRKLKNDGIDPNNIIVRGKRNKKKNLRDDFIEL